MALEVPVSLSPSKVSSFKDCALAFRFSAIDRLPEAPSAPATKGTLVHDALRRLLWRPAHERDLPNAMLDLAAAQRAIESDPDYVGLELSAEDAGRFYADAEELVRKYFELEDPATVSPMGLELDLSVAVGSLRLRGIIDRLERDADGGLVVTDYKGLAVETELPTPSGWTTMGEVQPGDLLMGANGLPTRVLEKSETHFRPCFRIEFDDASSIVCDNEHLWSVSVGTGDRATAKVLNADELFDLWERGTRPVTIPNSAALDLPPADLPIDPYVLGVWLGDGNSRRGYIHVCSADAEHFAASLSERGETVRDVTWPSERAKNMRVLSVGKPNPGLCNRGHSNRAPNRPGGRIGDCRDCSREHKGFPVNATLYARLSSLDLIGRTARGDGWRKPAPAKSIPPQYLRGSREQRLDLLRGLMDTDGYWNPRRRQGVFSTTNEFLAAGVADLVCGLGAKASTYAAPYVAARGPRTSYMVVFTPVRFNPFSLHRKASACAIPERPLRAGRRAIRDVKRVLTVPTQCVLVDAPDSLYLAGRQMVPTHNTGGTPKVQYEQGRLGGVHFYAFLCEQLLGERPARVQLLYLSEPIAIIATPSDQSIRGFQQKATAVWTAIERACERDDFRPRPSPLCNWCSFQAYCPAFGGNPQDARQPATIAS